MYGFYYFCTFFLLFRWGNNFATWRPRWRTRRKSWTSRLAPSRCWSRYRQSTVLPSQENIEHNIKAAFVNSWPLGGQKNANIDGQTNTEYELVRTSCPTTSEIKNVHSCSLRPHSKAGWKAGCHGEGGDAISLKYGGNGAHFQTVSPGSHS